MNASVLSRPLRILLLLAVCVGGGLRAQEADGSAPLEIVAVAVEPATVQADTLCRLAVELRNRGSQAADAFGFDVLVGGVSLAVYRSQLFLDPIAPGATQRIELFNFWSSESGRELPSEGQLEVEVRLREALWVEVGVREAADGDGEETVWEAKGPVPGLPVSGVARVDVDR